MRPCNQCGQPVENSVTVCKRCERWNDSEQGVDSSAPDSESGSQKRAECDSEIYADYSYAILMGAFSTVITALFGLIGLALYGFDGFVIGGSAGLVVGVLLFSVMIKM